MTDNTSRRSRDVNRLVRIAVALLLVVAGAFMLTNLDGEGAVVGSNTLRVPADGASPRFLADGSPVWIVRHKDRSVSVLGAVATEVWGYGNRAAWCAQSSSFENWFGARFNEYGTTWGGPVEGGLVVYEFVPAGPNSVTVTRAIGRLPIGQGKHVEQTAPFCQDGPGGEGTTSHYLAALRAASPGEPTNGELRRFEGNLVRAGDRAQLCVPSRGQCDWRLEVPGVSPKGFYNTGGPVTYIGRLRGGNRVTDLIV